MAHAFDITIRSHLQKVLEAVEKDWTHKNRKVKKIDQVRTVSLTLHDVSPQVIIEKQVNGSGFNWSKHVHKGFPQKHGKASK